MRTSQAEHVWSGIKSPTSELLVEAATTFATMTKGGKKDIVDLEQIILAWAKEMFRFTKTKDQGRIEKECLEYNINWKYVVFNFESPDYTIVPTPLRGGDGPKKNMQPQVLFRTVFTNTTKRDQEYSFKTERITRSAATVIVEKGVCRGVEMGLTLKTPCEVLEANAGFKSEISVVNIGEDTTEEELIWGVDSTVKVPAQTETVAELVVEEAQHQGGFIMHTHFYGRVIVSVTNLKDNNSLVTVIEGKVGDIIRNELGRGLRGFTVDGENVTYETRGQCHFKFGVEQRVRITEIPLVPS